MNGKDFSKKYIEKVIKKIRCDKKDKLDCIEPVKVAVEEAILQNDIKDYKTLVAHMGEPKDVAKEFESSIDPLLIKKHKRKKIIIISLIVILIIGLLIGFYCYLLYEVMQPTGYTVEYTASARDGSGTPIINPNEAVTVIYY